MFLEVRSDELNHTGLQCCEGQGDFTQEIKAGREGWTELSGGTLELSQSFC